MHLAPQKRKLCFNKTIYNEDTISHCEVNLTSAQD